jgi:putative protease
MPERPVGKVEHYYPKVNAAAVRLTRKVRLGDKVHIVGHGDDFEEKVTSLQLDHKPIEEGQPGQSIGLWVKERVHEGDDVLLVTGGKGKAPVAKAKPRKAASRPKKAPKRKSSPRRKSAKSRKAKAGKRPARKMARKPARKSSKKKR